jgi:hypothetical protein
MKGKNVGIAARRRGAEPTPTLSHSPAKLLHGGHAEEVFLV